MHVFQVLHTDHLWSSYEGGGDVEENKAKVTMQLYHVIKLFPLDLAVSKEMMGEELS